MRFAIAFFCLLFADRPGSNTTGVVGVVVFLCLWKISDQLEELKKKKS